jgi:acetyl esterase/lipase
MSSSGSIVFVVLYSLAPASRFDAKAERCGGRDLMIVER